MISVNDATKTAYKTSSTSKTVTITCASKNITLTNSDLVQESVELTEAIENGEELNFQGCIATQLKFSCAGLVTDIRGEYIEASIKAGNTTVIPLFKGYVDTQTNRTQEDAVTQITAYDVLYTKGQLDVTDWYNNLSFPRTLKSFRDAFFSYIGVTQQSITLVNDSLRINKVVTNNQITALDVMQAICQANGVYGQISRSTGTLRYIEIQEVVRGLYPSETTYPSTTTYPARENAAITLEPQDYIKCNYEPFLVNYINKVTIIDFNGTRAGEYGNGTNILSIHDNIVAQGCTAPNTMAENIYSKVQYAQYIPSKVKTAGFPWVECGDIYLFNTSRTVVRAYVLNRELKGIQALFDEYESGGTQVRSLYKESTKTQTTANESGIQENAEEIEETKQLIVDEIYAEQIRTNTLVANAIQTTELYADRIGANAIQTSELYADRIVSNAIYTTEAYADRIVANAITTTELYADRITANAITTTEAYADRITANAISTTKLYADTVSTQKMDAAEAYAAQLNADKATISQLDSTNATISQLNSELVGTNQVLATKASISQLNSVTINASQITAGTISTQRLSIDGIVQGMSTKNLTVSNLNATGLITIGPYVAHWNSGTFKDGSGNNVTITYLGR